MYMYGMFIYNPYINIFFLNIKGIKWKKGAELHHAFKIIEKKNYQKIYQQFNVNSDRLVKSTFCNPPI